jgi:hypothetical protein
VRDAEQSSGWRSKQKGKNTRIGFVINEIVLIVSFRNLEGLDNKGDSSHNKHQVHNI